MKKIRKFKRQISMLLTMTMLLSLVQVPYTVHAKDLADDASDNVEVVMEEYEILPSPHSISYDDEYTVYNPLINVVYSEASVDSVTIDYIKEIFGSENVTFAAAADDAKTNLYVSRNDMDDEVETWLRNTYADVIDDTVLAENESHIIIADENGISIIGNDDIGLFRGLTTIKFILAQIESNENGYRHFVINDYADMPFRGLIEGYYGEPWSWADRAELLRFGSGFKMNKIVFAPKNDPYHYAKWDELYPDQSADAENNIQNIEIAASMGRKYKVDFVWTAHCFIKGDDGIRYTAGDENVAGSDINQLIAKFEQLYAVGVRSFGLLLDDIEYGPRTLEGGHYNKNEPLTDEVLAETTAIVNIMADWCTEKGDCDDLMFCPAGFVTDWMVNGFSLFFTQAYPYQELSYYDHNFRENVHIMTTGNGVFSDADQSVADRFKREYINEQNGYETGDERRSPLMWNNYPTVDASPELDMGPIENFRTNLNPDDMIGLLSNPFQWAHINKTVIPMVTQYTWNLKDYDAAEVYNDSMKYIAGSEELGEALRIFSNHNSTRGSEGEGSEELKTAIAAFKADYNAETAAAVLVEIDKVVDACEKLLVEEDHVDAGLYRQVKPYANALKDLASSIQRYMYIFSPEKNPMIMSAEAKTLYSGHTGYSIGTWGKHAVVGTRTLVPFAQWLESNSARLIAASDHEGFELEMLIAELEVMDFTWHDEDSVAALQTVLAESKTVAQNADATQEERDAALANLQAARDALVFILDGSGTEEDPYLVGTEEDLISVSTVVNGSASFANAHYKMTADIHMTSVDFQPIGMTNHFTGVFDGDGYTISNLIISKPADANVGLFSFVEGGTVKNVGIRSGSINGNTKVGGLVGRTMYATILNCFSKANVVAASNDCGGLIGMLNNSTVKNCYTFGSVTASGESIGGLFGSVNRSIDTSTGCTVENCYTIATVTGPKYTGTLIGYDESATGEIYTITYNNLYYAEGTTPVGNNEAAPVIALSADSFTNGELLEKLNSGLADGCAEWVTSITGYPEFTVGVAEEYDSTELEAVIEEVEVMDLSVYSDATVAAVNAAVDEAKKLLTTPGTTQLDIDAAVQSIKNAVDGLVEAPYLTVTTNMAVYDVYGINNVADGDHSTIFWKAGVQAAGDYILYKYRSPINVSSVRLISVENSDMLEGADVQVSTDGSNWTTVGSFTKQTDQTVEFEPVSAKYVRIYITVGTASWLKVAEVIVNNQVVADKTELEALLAEVDALDLSIYTDDTVELLNSALDQARAVMNSDSATQDDVDSAIAYVRMRKDNLVEKPVESPEIELSKMTATAGDAETDGGNAEGPASLAIDDDVNTKWHTQWYPENNNTHENHWLQLELDAVYVVDGFKYLPRQDGSTNGDITGYSIRVSLDGKNWTTVSEGEWALDKEWKEITFEAQNAKYVRLQTVAASSDQDNESGGYKKFAAAAEVRVTGVKLECAEHTTELRDAVEATCTKDGYTGNVICVDCLTVLEEGEVLPALGHNYGEWVTVKEPTTREDGLKERVCAACGEKEEEIIPKLPTDKASLTAKVTEYAAVDTSVYTDETAAAFADALAAAKEVIANEEATQDEVDEALAALEAAYAALKEKPVEPEPELNIIPVSEMTVTAGDEELINSDQSVEGPAGLAIDENEGTFWHTDWYEGPNHDDHWLQLELNCAYMVDSYRYLPRQSNGSAGNTNGTVTAYKILVSEDGVNFTEVAEGTWPADSEWKTAEFDAVKAKYVRLKVEEAESDIGIALACASEVRLTGTKVECAEHTTEIRGAVEATCTEPGHTGNEVCTNCLVVVAAGEEIPALGHSYGEAVVTPATCTEDGSSVKTCAICGEEEVEVLKATGHEFGEWTEVKAATCSEAGSEERVCSACNEKETREIEALGHTWGEWTVVKAATAKEAGLEERVCTVCGEKEQREIPMLDFENPFIDVPEGEWYYDAVMWGAMNEVVAGITKTEFYPDAECTRAQIVAFLWRAAGRPEAAITECPFTDVSKDAYYYKAMLWAVEEEIAKGYSTTLFAPDVTCSRAEMAAFLWRLDGRKAVEGENPFTDISEADWFYDAVIWASQNNVVSGYKDGTFTPDNTIARAETVTMLYRYFRDK